MSPLSLSGDISANPGLHSKFPRSMRTRLVNLNQKGICSVQNSPAQFTSPRSRQNLLFCRERLKMDQDATNVQSHLHRFFVDVLDAFVLWETAKKEKRSASKGKTFRD